MKRIHFALRRLGGLFALSVFGALTLLFATSAMAGGGYIGPGPAIVTVQEILQRKFTSGKVLSIRGQITQYNGLYDSSCDFYSFTDSTGTIKVLIPVRDQDVWMGKYVDSSDTVEVLGTLDFLGDEATFVVRRIVKR